MNIAMQEDEMAKVVTMREAIAVRINDLSQRWAENTIALGREFKRARDSFPITPQGNRPGWHDWIEANTPWKANHGAKFIRIAERCGKLLGSSRSITRISLEALTIISSPDVSEEVTREVIDRAKEGEKVTFAKAKEIVSERARPKPKEANEKAKETGKAILASDGNYYFGTSKEAAEAYERKKEIVYGVRRAVERLSDVGMTPAAFLKYADKHQLWRLDEEHQITAAHDWLSGLLEAWENR